MIIILDLIDDMVFEVIPLIEFNQVRNYLES